MSVPLTTIKLHLHCLRINILLDRVVSLPARVSHTDPRNCIDIPNTDLDYSRASAVTSPALLQAFRSPVAHEFLKNVSNPHRVIRPTPGEPTNLDSQIRPCPFTYPYSPEASPSVTLAITVSSPIYPAFQTGTCLMSIVLDNSSRCPHTVIFVRWKSAIVAGYEGPRPSTLRR